MAAKVELLKQGSHGIKLQAMWKSKCKKREGMIGEIEKTKTWKINGDGCNKERKKRSKISMRGE